MSKSPVSKRVEILKMLNEGVSMRSTARMAGVSLNTVSKLLADAGEACLELHDELVRHVDAERIECDEAWSFIHTREGNKAHAKNPTPEHGDVWTWLCMASDTRLVISYLAGQRTRISGETFLRDIADRVDLTKPTQVSTDGFPFYVGAVQRIFGEEIDHSVLVKTYANVPSTTRYAPLQVTGTKRNAISGDPDLSRACTSYVERANLSMRMGMRRFTRLTNAHSKKYASHVYALAIFFFVHNFIKRNPTIKTTPALAAKITDRQWTFEDIVARIERNAPKTGPKGPRVVREVQG
jgi:IS1 family transposase